MIKQYRTQITFLISGVFIGFLLFHPYTMFVYSFMHIVGHDAPKTLSGWQNLSDAIRSTFTPTMLPMALSFAFFNGIIGFLLGILIDKRRRLEQEKIALQTLNRLMITLSHYLLNANTVIGGLAGRCKRTTPVKDFLCSDVIVEEAKKIDAVIRTLKGLTEIRTADYAAGGKAKMIDIAREIESLLNGPQRKDTGSSDLSQDS